MVADELSGMRYGIVHAIVALRGGFWGKYVLNIVKALFSKANCCKFAP